MPTSCVARLTGYRGKAMAEIGQRTGALVTLTTASARDPEGVRYVQIRGSANAIFEATSELRMMTGESVSAPISVSSFRGYSTTKHGNSDDIEDNYTSLVGM